MAILFGTNGADNLSGGLEIDTIFGAGGNDTLLGNGGNDNIYGDSGNDSLISGPGLDFIYGGEGDDILNATAQNDDNLFGGIGNDIYQVSRTTDSIIEGSNQGIDTVQSPVTYILNQANVENLVLIGNISINGTGNSLNNQITGNSGRNDLNGLDGNDVLNGLYANDVLTGGGGNDQFLFNTALSVPNIDTINSFEVGIDKIILDKSVFSALETVADNFLLATDFSVINAFAADEQVAAATSSGEIVYNRMTGNLFYNENDGATGFGIGGAQFATIVGSPDNLSNTDFRVVP
jgi:Ca2+-binding RTX toxin-like protein